MFYSIQQVEQYVKGREQYGIKPGLERVYFLLKNMDHPEQQMKGIHVAGTNGKGSTIQFIHDALLVHNYDVGLFTSPSFTGLTGHFLINGKAISETDLIRLMNDLLPAIEQLDRQQNHPTPFELLTVLAFMYFHETAEIVLIETGMGGRFDTTNCFVPLISIITTIAKDHMQFLGESIEEIAHHKAGIMKKNRPVVTGKINMQAMEVIKQEAKDIFAPIYAMNDTYYVQGTQIHIPNQQINIDTTNFTLQGEHQRENAATALMALALLRDEGFCLRWDLVARSMERTTLPGRFEIVHENPTIILDSAHNLAGITALKQALLAKKYNVPIHLIFAGFRDKPIVEMLVELEPLFSTMSVTTFAHQRAANVNELHQLLGEQQQLAVQIEENWQDAVDKIFDNKKNEVYCMTGSLHYITLVRKYILNRTSFYR